MTVGSPPTTAAQRDVAERLGPGDVAALVLATPVGGRGPVDPVGDGPVPDRELLRVCVSTLAAWCRSAPAAAPPREARARRRRPWHPAYRVVGRSPHAEAVRAALSAAGYAEGGRRATALVVGGPLDAVAAGQWRHRVQRGAGLRWRRVWDAAVAHRSLPAALDLAAQGRSVAADPRVSRVHVVNLQTPADAVRAAADVLGVDLGAATDRTDPAETDLLRRLNQALATAPPHARSRPLAGDLAERFDGRWTEPLGVPRPALAWAVERAEALAADLADGPWENHGDPRSVVPSTRADLPRAVRVDRTLGVALRVLADLPADLRGEGGATWPTG